MLPADIFTPAGSLRALAQRTQWRPYRLRLVAFQMVLTLGLLSPLICVIHCAIHSPRGDAQSSTVHAHHTYHGAAELTAPGAPAPVPSLICTIPRQSHTPASDSPAVPKPRALYELLGGTIVLLATLAGLVGALARLAPALPLPLAPTPPTPPPRLA
jgi:hypothetical protein